MSTAKTDIGCMAEDYGVELQTIVGQWFRYLLDQNTDPRLASVAESFLACKSTTSIINASKG